MKLSEHFNLSEFQRKGTATARGIDNTIPEALIPSIKNLCVNVLEPLREHVINLAHFKSHVAGGF